MCDGILKRFCVSTKLCSYGTFVEIQKLDVLQFQIDSLLCVVDALKTSIRHKNVVFQGQIGTLHLQINRGQNRFVIDGAVISVGIDNVAAGVIADNHVVDLTQFRVLFGVSPRGIRNRCRVR